MNHVFRGVWCAVAALTVLCVAVEGDAEPETGVSDDRVSLPEGPGSLEGVGENVDLDPNMGVMRYGVPIQIPEGFPSMKPPLTLGYSSGDGGGVVGIGWRMEMPYIERMTYRGLPEYQRDDDFCMGGGNQLVLSPNSEPPTYRARYEKEFVRYRWREAGDGSEGYWTAEYPDGRVGYFGAMADGTIVDSARVSGDQGTFRYMLVEMTDVYGHRVHYNYQKYGNVALVRSVGYVFTEGPDTPRYSVSFQYEERMDETGFDYLSDAKAGFDELLTQRLMAINVFSGAERIRRYELTYETYAESGGFTRLKQVQMLGLNSEPYPIHYSFSYSQALGGVCEDGQCGRPFMTDMGNIGVNIGVGRASLVDINGDALPDIIDTSDDGPHRFILNVPSEDGASRFDVNPVESAVGTGSGFRLGTPYVQVLDVNGDGFTDMIHAQNGRTLINRGNGDWEMMSTNGTGTETVSQLFGSDFDAGNGELRTIKFLDYDNDKKIDVMRSTRTTTSIYRNLGTASGFEEDERVGLMGYGIQADNIEFTDMNGDGLLDPVKLNVGGLRYRLNLGWGRWGEEVEVLGLPINESELELAELEDLNGDGLSDLAVVVGSEVKYAINRNGAQFSNITTLNSDDVEGNIPQRDGTVTVLYADMNGNGSTDIVWLSAQGQVDVLELFPVRPNQLSRIENGIGKVTEITYGTSVQHMARDGGWEAWRYKLPHPMLVVDRVDDYDLLTNLHDITEYRYRSGYYDGIEKQFRGYEEVEIHRLSNDFQEEGLTLSVYDVGAEDPYTNGLLKSQTILSGGRILSQEENLYDDCEVAEVPEGTELPVRYVCQVGTRTVTQEGLEDTQHVVTETQSVYDGYGNVVLESQLGVTSIGGGGCEPCTRDVSSEFGVPCGAQCLGDEMFMETDYVRPGPDTSGRWILTSPYRERSSGSLDSIFKSEQLTYYDEGNTPFEGMNLGTLDQGKVTRVTDRKEPGSEVVITTTRNRHDRHGNIIETIDANGSPGEHAHRRLYTIDEDGLRVVQTDVALNDADGNPTMLRREVQYEPVFDKIVESTAWMRVEEGQVQSPRRSTTYTYDNFGRLDTQVLPGDSVASPSEEYRYELGNPTSRIVTLQRSQIGGATDLETVHCLDGKGRMFQTRTRLAPGLYQVDGFTVFNTRSAAVRTYQPYQSSNMGCDTSPPEGVLYTESHYDATFRVVEESAPDEGIYGSASVTQTVYEPFATRVFDPEDSDPSSPHADTPVVTRTDGLGRTVIIERWLEPSLPPARIEAHYDGLGHLTGTTDDQGHRKVQTYDLLGRVLQVDDPNSAGPSLYTYDDMGNVIRAEDGRGVVTRSSYDGNNRLVARWDEAAPEQTRITWTFDQSPDCDPQVCTNTEGQVAQITYPGFEGEAPGVDWIGYDARARTILNVRVMQDHPFTTETIYDNIGRVVA
ncbi:MAG: SpvB/TcaC N-terminal domain-containing protein, partial [Myxococcota bacterium]